MLHAVILAGGSGTRLWPLSRAANPKFLHALTGTPATLLQATAERVAPLAEPSRLYVVTGVSHAAAVARQLPELPEENLLIEPAPRDSCAAIGLAAAVIQRRDPDAVMGSFASDHLVRDGERFVEVLRQAMAGAEQGFLMTVGISPTHPETGYGYLECSGLVGDGPVRRVHEFKEKPSYEVARAYVESGQYFWNASMFVWRVDAFLRELARQQPELHRGLCAIAEAWDTPRRDLVLAEIWPGLPKISVDYAVMEGAAAAGLVATVPGDFGWNDVGDFHTLGEVLPAGEGGNVVLDPGEKPEVLLLDSTGLIVVPQSGRLVAALGVEDMIVVDTPDAVLVCPRSRAQEIKRLVDALKERGESRLL
ncbi:MAG TPA: mannose-1-phosphate guanylyltransferase [Rugosimonospora sp.]|nr:mannose-1-phosphate guanylyltransferase [Rugosimonospora sp.]